MDGLLRRHQAIEPRALELGADALRLLRAGKRPDEHAVERSHVAHYRLIDLRLALGERGGVLAHDFGRKRLGLRLGAHRRDLNANVPALLAGLGQGGLPSRRLLFAGDGAGLDALAALALDLGLARPTVGRRLPGWRAALGGRGLG